MRTAWHKGVGERGVRERMRERTHTQTDRKKNPMRNGQRPKKPDKRHFDSRTTYVYVCVCVLYVYIRIAAWAIYRRTAI